LSRQKSSGYPPIANVTLVPIPIRPDLVVWVQGIPHDLTKAEAAKVVAVVAAHIAQRAEDAGSTL
jgi:hypothetical protein